MSIVTIKSTPHGQHLGTFIRRGRSWEFLPFLFQGPHPLLLPSPGRITRFSQLPQKSPGIPAPMFVSSPAPWVGNLSSCQLKRALGLAECFAVAILNLFSFSFFLSFWLHWVFIAALRPSLAVACQGYCLVAAHKFLTAVASLVAEHRL